MKQLSLMNNVEKARLLHQLLPGSIPAFIKTVEIIAAHVKAAEEELYKTWDNPIITPAFWLRLAADSQTIINKYGKQLYNSPAIFSDQLFDGYNSLFLNHCIAQHAGLEGTDSDFKNAFKLLYGRD